MRISNNRYDKDRRRYDLALQMIELDARTTTIARWTGLSVYRIQTLFRSYKQPHSRPRGYPPTQVDYFSRTLGMEVESTTLAAIAWAWNVIPADWTPNIALSLPTLARGERLVQAMRMYRGVFREPRISLEYAVLLMSELAERNMLTLGRCAQCDSLMLVNRLRLNLDLCPFCRSRRGEPPPRSTDSAPTASL